MSEQQRDPRERRVLLLAPTARDAQTCRELFDAQGIDSFICNGIDHLCREAEAGAGAAVVTAEAILLDKDGALARFSDAQPRWSDLPIIVLTEAGIDAAPVVNLLHAAGNITLAKRPVQISTFISTVKAALRDRERQYQAREYISERESLLASLRENDRRKDEFIAMLGHELRNPLSAIANAVQIMKIDSSDQHREWCNAVTEKQVRHLTRMIDDLLDVSRITRGKIELRRETLTLFSVLSSAIATVRPLLRSRNHTLEVILDVDDAHVQGDPTRLEQVFVNLLNNAAKYTPSGGVIRLSAELEGKTAVVRIEDNGIGMSPEMLQRAFELFAQDDRSAARTEGGLGIGLTLVRRLIELHGGMVGAESEGHGKGSRFTVRLPTLDTALKVQQTRVDGTRSRILLIEQDRDEAIRLQRALRLLGHQVTIAHDGPTALTKARAEAPDYVVIDLSIEESEPIELARRVYTEAACQPVLIAVSDRPSTADGERQLPPGTIPYRLSRPIDFNSLALLLGHPT